MKKFLFLGAMAAMLLGTASCSNDMEPEMTGDGNVQFTIELPGNIDSRAISDGLIATKLQVAVYKEDGTLLNDISLLGEKAVTMTDRKATVNFKLVKGLKYSFAFWAQNPNEDAYTFDATTGKVKVDYSKAVANADDGDAFSNREMNLEITGPITKTITLTRPFAQLNYGDVMEDYAVAVAAGIDFKQTAVTVKQVANEYDILNQTTTGEVADITWAAANSAMEENLVVNEEAYKWLSMCYFLVPNDESTVTTELSMLNAAGSEFNKITVDNVPVKKNHRTNILGSLFTEDVNFNVIIDQNFDTPDYNVDYPEITDVVYGTDGTEYSLPSEAILADKAKGVNDIVITLAKGTYTDVLTNNNLGTFNSLTIKAAEGVAPEDVVIDGQCFFSSRNVTIKGITLTNANAPGLAAIVDQYGGNGKGFQTQKTLVLIWTSGTYNFENCIFDNVSPDATGIYTYWLTEQSTVNVKNCTFKGSGTLQRAIQIYGKTTSRIENCTFTDVYRYCACIHGGSNDIKWINNTVLGDGLNPSKKCNAIEHGSKSYARGANDPQDLIYVEGGNYPATGDKFVPYTQAFDEQPILSGTMPDGSVAVWQ